MEITNHGPDATITLKEKEQTELECVVREARPAASVIWYRNDVVLRTGKWIFDISSQYFLSTKNLSSLTYV